MLFWFIVYQLSVTSPENVAEVLHVVYFDDSDTLASLWLTPALDPIVSLSGGQSFVFLLGLRLLHPFLNRTSLRRFLENRGWALNHLKHAHRLDGLWGYEG